MKSGRFCLPCCEFRIFPRVVDLSARYLVIHFSMGINLAEEHPFCSY